MGQLIDALLEYSKAGELADTPAGEVEMDGVFAAGDRLSFGSDI